MKTLPSAGYETVSVGTSVYLSAGGLWRSDGTEAGTVAVVPDIAARRLTAFGSKLVFASRDPEGEHWFITDGTSADTAKLADGVGECTPRELGGAFYFCATGPDGIEGEELWITDGTPAGTKRWFDLNPFAASAAPNEFTMLGGQLLFSAYEGTTPSVYIADPAGPDPKERERDAGADAGVAEGGGDVDGSTNPITQSDAEDGCGCRTVATPSRETASGIWTAMAGVLLARRRRRGSR